MHNTRNGELPGHHLKEDYGLPEGPHASDLINRDSGVPIVQEHLQLSEPNLVNEPKTDAELASADKEVFGEDMSDEFHNTPNGELAGQTNPTEDLEPKGHATDRASLIQHPSLFKQKADAFNDAQAIATEARFKEEMAAEAKLLQRDADLHFYVNTIQGPEDLELLQYAPGQDDADGDGIEDKFYKPAVFGISEDIYNTRHGGLPGHRQAEFFDNQSEPKMNPTELIKSDYWNKLGVTPGGSEVPEGEPHAC